MSRKKSRKEKSKPKVEKLEGWTIGDYAWASYVDGTIVEGEVVDFYPNDNHGPCALIMTQNRGTRTVLIKNMDDKKIKKVRQKKSNK